MSDDPSYLEQMLHGEISLIVQRVALDPNSTPSIVLQHLIARLGRFLGPRSLGRLVVLWRGRGCSFGAECQAPKFEPEPLSAVSIAALDACFTDAPVDYHTWEPISISWWGADRRALRLSLSAPSDHSAPSDQDVLELLYDGNGNERWSWFVGYVRGLTELHHTVRGLLVARIGMIREHLKARIHALHSTRAVPLRKNLEEALKLLPRLLEIGAADLTEEMLISLMLYIFGTGWRVRTVRQYSAQMADHDLPGNTLRQLVDEVRIYASSAKSTHGARLLDLVDCLDAVISPRSPPAERPESGQTTLALFAMWTRVHELSRGLKRMPALKADAEGVWAPVVARTIPFLVTQLARPLEERRPEEQPRNWLVMWFCLDILRRQCEKPDDDRAAWSKARTELAYTLRESLRYQLFGHRIDYFNDHETLAVALAHLVAYHSGLIGVPAAYQVAALMDLIGGEGGENRYSAIEHLQHVAEIYISGHFFLSLRVNRNGSLATVGELFATTKLEGVVDKYRRAFSLAAVFHDVGHILLPSDVRLPRVRLLDDENVTKVLETRVEASVAHAKALTKRCIEDLGLSCNDDPGTKGSRRMVYFDERRVTEHLVGHFMRQATAGHANHGLLGAWYLHRVCEHAEKVKYEDAALREGRTMAVRAILLHDVATAEIDSDSDPIAALLVTCNEVFEWSPSRRAGTSPRSIGRSPQVVVTSPSYRVDRSIEIRHVACGNRSSPDRFEAVLTPSSKGTWPDIVVELMPPEYLDGPVLCVWLAKAQAMGRIKPGIRSGFAPMLRIRSALDPDLVHCELHTRLALQETLSRRNVLPELGEWCGFEKRFRYRQESLTEEVRLGYLDKQIYDGDIQGRISEIARWVAEYVESIERDLRHL